MSREYKFRGMTKTGGKVVKGSLLSVGKQRFIVVTPETSEQGLGHSEQIIEAGGPPIVDCIEVRPESVELLEIEP